MAMRFLTPEERIDSERGYAAYVAGHKIRLGASRVFIEGWWAAKDANERFGEYESFLAAPEPTRGGQG